MWDPPRIVSFSIFISFLTILNLYWLATCPVCIIHPPDKAFERGSDLLLDEKLRGKLRSLTNRAQSLDLTSLSRSENNYHSMRASLPDESTNPPLPTFVLAFMAAFQFVEGPNALLLSAPMHTNSHTHSHTSILPCNHNSVSTSMNPLPRHSH